MTVALSQPAMVVVRGAQSVPILAEPVVQIASALSVVPGQNSPIRALVRNPLKRAETVELTWQVPGSPDVKRMVKLAAGQSQTVELPVVLRRDARQGGVAEATLRYRDGGGVQNLTIPLAAAALVPRGEMTARAADFTLRTRDEIDNPNMVLLGADEFQWRGPDDLSAQIWLQDAGDALALRVLVRDDVFRQPFTNNDIWKGDSVQFAIQIPGQATPFLLGVARGADGQPIVINYVNGLGKNIAGRVDLKTTPGEGTMLYEARIPFDALGASSATLKAGVRLSVIVNDMDIVKDGSKPEREGYIFLSNGIGDGLRSAKFPLVKFE